MLKLGCRPGEARASFDLRQSRCCRQRFPSMHNLVSTSEQKSWHQGRKKSDGRGYQRLAAMCARCRPRPPPLEQLVQGTSSASLCQGRRIGHLCLATPNPHQLETCRSSLLSPTNFHPVDALWHLTRVKPLSSGIHDHGCRCQLLSLLLPTMTMDTGRRIASRYELLRTFLLICRSK